MNTPQDLKPRNHNPLGAVLRHALEVKLRDHPEAFDCLIFPALPSDHNEVNAIIEPVATMLDRGERRQSYGDPIKARAMLIPDESLSFEVTDSGLYQSFGGASEAINLLISEQGIRTYSLVQWLEYPNLDAEATVERTVYVASMRPLGRILGAGVAHVCYPLPALGEIPEIEIPEIETPETPEGEDAETDTPETLPLGEGFARLNEVGEL